MARIVLMFLSLVLGVRGGVVAQDYGDALAKSILFFEGQRSGKLPSTQRMSWRHDSALNDGDDAKMDLTGGYYDAGDNVKFNFPMAFSITMLAWSAGEYADYLGSEAKHAQEAIRWGTDYLLKATCHDDVVVAQVGDPNADHNCWMRPEDMDTPRTVYVVNSTHPGSEVSGEIAAALAASSIVFNDTDPEYSQTLLDRAVKVFQFADKYKGSYQYSVGGGVCPFYCDYNGYMDELVWAAAWLYAATGTKSYLDYVNSNFYNLPVSTKRILSRRGLLGWGGNAFEFGWDAEQAGISVLMSKYVVPSSASETNTFYANADAFVCSLLPDSPSRSVEYTPGGLIFRPGGSNLQHSTSLAFLLLTYARQLNNADRRVSCGNERLLVVAKRQVDYILGENPLQMSYMVGYGNKHPQRIHHRGSSLPSITTHSEKIACKDGTPYYLSGYPNPNELTGALVGGPAKDDSFSDIRGDPGQSEPTTYINAPFVGLLAYFKGK